VHAVQTQLNPVKIFWFYVKRAARLQQHIERALKSALSLRPEFCGNYDISAGKLPGARSEAIAFWSHFHSRCLARIGVFLLLTLSVLVLVCLALILTIEAEGQRRRWIVLFVFIAVCCLMSFVVAAFADAWDNVKHQFLFNLLLDSCLIFVVVLAAEDLRDLTGIGNRSEVIRSS
jgi:hypothetical protein